MRERVAPVVLDFEPAIAMIEGFGDPGSQP